MMLFVFSFNDSRGHYDVYFDTVSEYSRVLFQGQAPQSQFRSSPLNGTPVEGQNGKQCVDNVYYQFYHNQSTPFVTFTKTPGGCPNPTPVCDLTITSLEVLPESYLNGKNGQATVIASSSSQSIFYSIDDVNYNTLFNNVFIKLSPGDYTAYVKDGNGCRVSQPFTILPYIPRMGCTDSSALNYDPSAEVNNGTCVYPNPDQPANLDNNLYEQPDEFRIIVGNDTYRIDEPKDWDKITVVLKRDPVYHGVNYEFTDGDIKLRFDDDAGRQIIQAAYDASGNDADVKLQFGKDQYGLFLVDFDGYIDFNSFEKQENYIMVGVKRKTFNDLLETRADTLVSLANGAINLPLHSKLIKKQTLVNTGQKIGDLQVLSVNKRNGNGPPPPPYNNQNLAYWNYIDFSGASQNDLCQDAPLGGSFYVDNPINTGQYIFKTDGGGVFNLDISFSHIIHIKLNSPFIGNPDINNYTYRWYLSINGFVNRYELPGSLSGFQDGQYLDKQYSTSFQKTLTLNQNDEVYLFGEFVCNDDGNKPNVNTHIDQIFQKVTISANTQALPTNTRAYMAFEVADSIIKFVTDGGAYLKSNLLGRTDIGYSSDGCAALISYTNGYQIRGFDIENRPIQLAFKDWLQGLNATYCVGMGYELDAINNYFVRVEKFDYFYQETELLFLDGVSDYVEDIDTNLIYNEIEIGYKKFTNNLPQSSNTLDEFCTLHDYLSPIQSFKAKLTQQCNQIASGYAIELTRRLSFAETPEDSWTYDEDNFIISTVRSGGSFKSEQSENFTASGIVGPETAYNLRLSPKRMLDRWAKFLNSGFAYKKPSDILKNTFVAKNGDLVSQLITPDGCDSLQQFVESGDLTLGNYHDFEKSFYPATITFKKRISWDTMRSLRRAHQSGNNGYISVVDCNGETQQGFLMEVNYNPESELANFTLRKKYVDLSVPFDCSEYSGYTFGDFESSTGIPIEIEQCLFENFV